MPFSAKTVIDLVKRDFRRDGPNQLWVSDITEHPTREGKLYCCIVLDAYSRRVVGRAGSYAEAASRAAPGATQGGRPLALAAQTVRRGVQG